MYHFYEIRNRGTHRIEYMDLFPDTQKPDEAFRKNPASKHFANRLDLYINIASESFESLERAQSFLHEKRQEYKLLRETQKEDAAALESSQEQEKSEIQETEVVHNDNPGSETAPTPEVPKKSSRSRKPKTDKK